MSESRNLPAKIGASESLITITGGAEFTATERASIEKRMTKDTARYLEFAGRELLVIDSAETDLQTRIRRLERNLRETKEFQSLTAAKKELRLVRARRGELRSRIMGVLESILGGLRPGTSLYKKLLMLNQNSDGEA